MRPATSTVAAVTGSMPVSLTWLACMPDPREEPCRRNRPLRGLMDLYRAAGDGPLMRALSAVWLHEVGDALGILCCGYGLGRGTPS